MASACVNNIGIPSEKFLDCTPVKCPSYGWLNPRFSLSREFPDEVSKAASNKSSAKNQAESSIVDAEKPEDSDPEISRNDFIDFEFRLVDPVAMLTADELFSNGKLLPLHLSTIRQSMISHPATPEIRPSDSPEIRRRDEISSKDPYLFSPKAPRCTSTTRWKEILGLKKLYQNANGNKQLQDGHKTASSKLSSPNINNSKAGRISLKHFLHRSSKSGLNASVDSSLLSIPLLKESDNEALMSSSSRLSLSSSSSSSGHDQYDDLPRLSLDSDKPTTINSRNLSKVRVVKHRSKTSDNQTASPRMNSYGKIVFHGLERSSSSPGTFNGGPAAARSYKSRVLMERSYSANIRVTPVLNVPVCSLRGSSSKSGVFGLFSTQHKKDSGNTTVVGGGGNRTKHHHVKNRTDRT